MESDSDGNLKQSYRVGDCYVDPETNCIVREGAEYSVNPRSMTLLVILIENAGRVVNGNELHERVWPANHVNDNAVYKAINELRAAFGDSSKEPAYIATRPRKGYQLVAPVSDGSATPAKEPNAPGMLRPRPALGAIAIASLAALLWWLASGDNTSPEKNLECTTPKLTSLAFIGFRDAVADDLPVPEAYGLIDPLLGGLLEHSWINVKDPAQSLAYSMRQVTTAEIGAKLDAKHVLAADVVGRYLEIKLIRLTDDLVLMHKRYPWPERASPEAARRTAERIALALPILLYECMRQKMFFNGGSDPEAYALLNKALEHMPRDGKANTLARMEVFRRVIELDPNFTEAYVGIAASLHRLTDYVTKLEADQLYEKYFALMREASEQGADDEVKGFLALWAASMETDLIEKERIIRERILNPIKGDHKRHYGIYYDLYGRLLRESGLFELGDRFARRAVALCHADGECQDMDIPAPSWASVLLRDGAQAAADALKEAYIRNPSDASTLSALSSLLARLGRYAEAENYLNRMAQIEDAGEIMLHTKAVISVYRGTLSSAATAEQFFAEYPTVTDTTKGAVWFMMGDIERGVSTWAEIPGDRRSRLNRFVRYIEHHFPAEVRSAPAYQQLLNRLGFGSEWQAYLRSMVAQISAITMINPEGNAAGAK